MQQLLSEQSAVKTKSASSQKDFLQRNDTSGAMWLHQVAKGQHHTVSLSSLLWGAAMQPCSAVSERKKPLLFGMAAFKTCFSPHCISNMRSTGVFSNHFSLTVLHQNKVTDSSPSQRPPLLARVANNFKSFSVSLGGKKSTEVGPTEIF